MSDLIPLLEGGAWLAEGGTGTPVYIVNGDHIERLLLSGFQPIPDPRINVAVGETLEPVVTQVAPSPAPQAPVAPTEADNAPEDIALLPTPKQPTN